MAANSKNSDFITRSRQAAKAVLEALKTLDDLRLQWDSLYNSTVTADDFDGSNAVISLADITAEFTTQAAIDGLMDAGHRTNLLKVE